METFRRCLDFNLSCCKYLNELVDVQNPNHCEFYPLDVLASVEENKSLGFFGKNVITLHLNVVSSCQCVDLWWILLMFVTWRISYVT